MSAGTSRAVLHIASFLQGGAGRAVTDLAIGQQRAGHRVAVATSLTGAPGYGNYPEYLDRLRDAGVPLVVADSAFARDPALNQALAQIIRETLPVDAFDVIHAHAGTPALVGLLVSGASYRWRPVVQTMHGWGINKTPEQAERDLKLLRHVARVIVTSDASGDDLVAMGIPRAQLVTIPCGIQAEPPVGAWPDEWAPLARARAGGAAVLVTLGSVSPQKNQRLLVEALPAILTRRPVVVAIVGEGPEIPRLLARAAELGVSGLVHAPGYLPDPARVLEAADLVVQPSRAEGQGVTVLEAFRARRPVIASDIPSLRELVRDGETGFLFADNDPAALASAVHRALDQPSADRAALVERAHAHFLRRYTCEAMLAAHDALYASLG